MLSFFKIVTVNHRYLNTKDLENFVIRYDSDRDFNCQLLNIREALGQEEVLYLNTCNRILFVFFGKVSLKTSDKKRLFEMVNPKINGLENIDLDSAVEIYTGLDALNHLFQVASSMESLVVGERQIFRQFRNAYTRCQELELCGDNIRLVEKCTVKAAKDVYTKTEIGSRPVSIVSLVIKNFLKKKLDRSARILLIGAGETNTTVSRYLKKNGYENLVVFNRTLEKAVRLSDDLGVEAFQLDQLETYAGGFDCIFACTSAQVPILDKPIFDLITKGHNKKIIADLAIPHNVSAELAMDDRVDYISLDSIKEEAEENLKFRSGNIDAAQFIINKHLEEFALLYDRRQVERAFSSLPEEIRKVKERAINNVYKSKIDQVPEETKILIYEIVDYMEKKCTAVPIKLAKNSIQ